MNHTIYLDERVALTPSELNLVHKIRDSAGINNLLVEKLREKHEEKCNSNGYVQRNSIEMLGRSIGVAENGRFTGNVLYDCKFKCNVIYPTAGTIVKTRVVKVNNMGVYVVYPENDGEEAIRILLPRDLHMGNEEYNALEAENRVYVRIERSRFQTNDRFIMAVGLISPTPAEDAIPVVQDEHPNNLPDLEPSVPAAAAPQIAPTLTETIDAVLDAAGEVIAI
jgi:DNA-directed RNA polymerase subunit E'/Rpb7